MEASKNGCQSPKQSRLSRILILLRDLAWVGVLASGTCACILWLFLVSPMMRSAIGDLAAPIHAALGFSLAAALLLTAYTRRQSRA